MSSFNGDDEDVDHADDNGVIVEFAERRYEKSDDGIALVMINPA